MKLYPFENRLILYFTPCLILLAGNGFVYIFEILKLKTTKNIQLSISGILILILIIQLPLKREEIKENLVFLSTNKKSNENLYIYYGAKNALKYYQIIGLYKYDPLIIIGNVYRETPELYFEEIKKIKNKTWLLFSHNHEDEEEFIINQIKNNNYKIVYCSKTTGSSLYLIEKK